MIILPVLVFFWFGVFALFLLILSKSQSISQIVLIAAAIVAATRLTSYFSQDLSKDLAKLLPFTMLAVFLLDTKGFFNFSNIMSRFSEIPLIIHEIFAYLVFIIIIEIIMRGLFTLVELSGEIFSNKSEEQK